MSTEIKSAMTRVREILDSVLLSEGILSSHLRRIKATAIADSQVPVKEDEYVVFSLVSSHNWVFGDGKAKTVKRYFDVNYYYDFDKSDARFADADGRVNALIAAFSADHQFRIANGKSDLYDAEGEIRGINFEVVWIGVDTDG